jgi:peptidylprolyl isomerase
MRKSEKVKGKSAGENRKEIYTWYALGAAAIIVVLLIVGFYLFNPFVAKKGDTVVVYYTGTLENGTVFDSNIDRDPLIITIGNGNVIPGFEEAIIGMSVNATKTVYIPVEKAYGPHLDSLIHVVNRTNLPPDMEPEAGKFYTITRKADNAVARVLILNVTSDTVTLDENHMLAGQNLTFTLRFAGFYRK